MNVWKRGLALLLGCVLLFALLPPVGTSRAEDELPIIPIVPIYKGVCGAQGDNLTWTLNSGTGVLTISGSGEMMDFAQTGQPWYQWRQKVRQLVFSAEMTGIGDNAFRGCTQLKEAILPENLLRIGTDAFAGCTALTALTVENPDCAVADGGATLGVPSITAVTADCGGSVAAYALDKDYQTALRHPERTTETVAPTCTEDGYTLHVCPRCGDSYRDGTVPAPGHDWGQPHYVWAADNGSVTASRTCKRDPAHVETETVNTTAAVSTAPTCTEAGKTTYTAAFENPAFAAQTRTLTNVPAAGHVPGEAVVENRVEPSCTGKGSYEAVVYCTVCKAELSRTPVELSATGHTQGAPVEENRVEPSCTAVGGYDTVVCCAVCGEELQRTHVELPMLAHTAGATVEENRVEPDCVTAGGYDSVTYCAVCHTELRRVHTVLAALGHTPGAAVEENRVEPTCTEEGGYDTVTYCTVCHTELGWGHTVLAALGHTEGDPVEENRVEPSCVTAGGYDSVTYCTVCHTELYWTDVVIPALGHSYQSVVTEPTCTEQGYTTDTCTRCGDVRIGKETPPKGHSWDAGTVTLAPTEDAEGVMTFTCLRCEATQTQPIPKSDHVHNFTDVVTPPTCTAQGYTTHSCAKCGASYVDSYVEALGHDWEQPHYTWAADHSLVTGERSCRRDPSHKETEAVTPSAAVSKAATCTTDGETTYTGVFENPAFETQSKTVTDLPATGHTPGQPVEENRVAPTCTADGGYDTVVFCTACSLELERAHVTLPATGHDWQTPRYVWSADNGTVSASRSCRNDPAHLETETAVTAAEITKPATCTVPGETTYTATFENPAFATQVKTLTNLAALGHSPGAAVEENRVEPSCTEKGSYASVIYCTVCKAELSRVSIELPATGHTPGTAVEENRTEPTCTAPGGYDAVVYCTVCKAELSRTWIEFPACGHSFGAWQASGETVAEAEHFRKCTVCGFCETGAHVWDEGQVSMEPDCGRAGERCFHCTLCGAERFETIPPTGQHTPGTPRTENEIAPTCTEIGGFDTVICCTVCETELSREHTELQAIGHDWNAPSYEWSEDNAAVTASRVCRNDETHVETETVAATSEVTKEATVDEEGEITYTAEFTNPAFEKQTKAVAIPKLKPANPFDDVVEGKFYYDAVLWAVNHEPQITNGTDATHFSPNATCTRGQVVTFLWRAKGCPEPTKTDSPFTDVTGGFYYKAVLWAVENGITNGTSATTFGPNDGCTRGQVVTFLWRTEGKPEPTTENNPFEDVTGGFYYKAVLWAVENKITAGMDATHFAPMNTCTRGQIVTFLYRDLAE